MRFVGVDASLTGTGLSDWHDGARNIHHHGEDGKRGATLQQRAERLERSLQDTLEWCLGPELPTAVIIEAHTFAARGGSQHDRSGLWWLIVHELVTLHGIPVIEVSPSQVKQFATGKGNAQKDAVVLAVARRHPTILFTTNDEADAITLVDMALARWSHDLFDPTAIQLKALEKVVWPEEWIS